MSQPPPPSPVRFGLFELDPATGELRKGGVKVHLQEQPFEVLALLVERPGELVTREELRQRLWPAAVFVDFDHGLGKAVSKVRAALGDLAESPRFVETLGHRGYRFIAPVERVHLPRGEGRRLVVARLVGARVTIPLGEGEHLAGRDPACAVWIDSSVVSRRHARLVIDDLGVTIEDLGSHNGTFVNGTRIASRCRLADRDEIGIGPARLLLRLSRDDETETASR